MQPKNPKRRSSFVVVIIAVFLLIGTGIAWVWYFRETDRSNPQSVHNRTIAALRSNDLSAVYEELSPEMKLLFPPESLLSSQPIATGLVIIDLLEAPQIRTENPWNGEWADARVRISHDNVVEDYLVRYHFEDSGWWLYATLKLQ
jgi:hypothetical protein